MRIQLTAVTFSVETLQPSTMQNKAKRRKKVTENFIFSSCSVYRCVCNIHVKVNVFVIACWKQICGSDQIMVVGLAEIDHCSSCLHRRKLGVNEVGTKLMIQNTRIGSTLWKNGHQRCQLAIMLLCWTHGEKQLRKNHIKHTSLRRSWRDSHYMAFGLI